METTHNMPGRRIATVKDAHTWPGCEWLTPRYARHLIFNAQDRLSSRGDILPGNGFDVCIIRIGRKVLLDLDAIDRWLDQHRVTPAVNMEEE